MSNVRCRRRKTFDFFFKGVISWSLQITKVGPLVSRLSLVQKATTFHDWFAHRHSHFLKCFSSLRPLKPWTLSLSKLLRPSIKTLYNYPDLQNLHKCCLFLHLDFLRGVFSMVLVLTHDSWRPQFSKATTFYDWFAHRHSHFPKCLGFFWDI